MDGRNTYLYKLHLTLQNGEGKVVEQIEQAVGFRSVEIEKRTTVSER